MIVISHTATTTFARQAREEALAAGARVVSITGEGKGWPEAIEAAPPERSETYTASYLAALLVLARLAAAVGAPNGERLEAMAPRARPASSHLESPRRPPGPGRSRRRRTDPDRAPAARLTVLFGAGPAAVTAREGALKLREASRVLAEGFESEYLLHGSAVPLTEDDHLIALDPDADPTGLTAEVARAAEHEGIAVTRLAPPPDLPPLLAQLPLTARLQSLASDWADLRAVDPDTVITGAWAAESFWA